jgi:hypothetical protein
MSGFGSGLGWGSKHRGVKRTTTTFFGVGGGGVLIPGRGTPWVGLCSRPGRGQLNKAYPAGNRGTEPVAILIPRGNNNQERNG